MNYSAPVRISSVLWLILGVASTAFPLTRVDSIKVWIDALGLPLLGLVQLLLAFVLWDLGRTTRTRPEVARRPIVVLFGMLTALAILSWNVSALLPALALGINALLLGIEAFRQKYQLSIWLLICSMITVYTAFQNLAHPLIRQTSIDAPWDALAHPLLGVVFLLFAGILGKLSRDARQAPVTARRPITVLFAGLTLIALLSWPGSSPAGALYCGSMAGLLLIEVLSWRVPRRRTPLSA